MSPPISETVTIRALASHVTSGSRGWGKLVRPSGAPFIGVGCLAKDGIGLDLSEARYVQPHDGDGEAHRTRVEEGDVLVSITADLGRIGLVGPDATGGYVNQHVALLRPDPLRVNSAFLAYYLATPAVRERLVSRRDVGAKIGFNLDTIADFEVRLPSRVEQDRIVEIVQTWDRGMEAGSALVAARRRALHVARRRLVEQAEADVAQLQSFAQNTNRLLPVEEAGRRDLPCIELEHMEEATGRLLGTADISQLRGARRAFEPGDVLYGRLRPYLRKFAYARAPGVCSTEVWVLSANPRLCSPGYLYQIVQTERFNTEANKSSGSRMPRADWEVLSQAEFPLPPLEQQRQISAFLATEEEALDLLVQLVDRLRLQRTGLMERLLSGALPMHRINAVSHEMTETAHA